MNFAFTEEQEFLRDTARRFLADKVPSEKVRELMETDHGFDQGLWVENAEMGWQAMAIPEAYGGAGFSFLELFVLFEEMGKALYPTPFLSSVVLGAYAVMGAGGEDQKKELLSGVASGDRRLALAVHEPDGHWDLDKVGMAVGKDGFDFVLNGAKSFVVDGHTADTLIVAARTPEGLSLFAVDGDGSGVQRRRLESMDMTRKLAEITFDDVRVSKEAMLGKAGTGTAVLEKAFRLGVVALAAEQVGGAQRCMEMSVDYAKERVQFGRPIGSFQAIKHKCADMLVAVESAKSAAYYAGWAASEDNEDLAVAAPLAKSYCSEAYFSVAADTIQVHGGIGFTWEHDAHLYFKRAKSSELLFGDPVYHRSLLGDQIGI